MKGFFCFIAFFINSFYIMSENYAISYGRSNEENGLMVLKNDDNNFILLGTTNSSGEGGIDALIIKIDSRGNVIWEKSYGGSGDDELYYIEKIQDGYLLAGKTNSFGAGGEDIWILSIDYEGNILWQKAYGTADDETAYIVTKLQSGEILVAGCASISFNNYQYNVLFLKLDSSGNLLSKRAYGTYNYPYAFSKDTNGNILVSGIIFDFWDFYIKPYVLKIFPNGWANNYLYDCNNDDPLPVSITNKTDGGFLVALYPTNADSNYFGKTIVLNLSSNGNIIWQKVLYGGGYVDIPFSIKEDSEQKIIILGETYSVLPYNKYYLWSEKLDLNGNIVWEKAYSYAKSNGYYSHCVEEISEGYLFLGLTYELGAGSYDLWLLKTDRDGNINPECILTPDISISDYNCAYDSDNLPYSTNVFEIIVSDTNAIAQETDVLSSIYCTDCLQNLGDVSENNLLTSYDASLLLQYVAGLKELNEFQKCKADVNENAQITSMDASYILQCVIGNCNSLPQNFKLACQSFGNCL